MASVGPTETDPMLNQDGGAKDNGSRKIPMIVGGICCGCICLYVVLVVVLAVILMKSAIGANSHDSGIESGHQVHKDGEFITPKDVTKYDWWPGCKYDQGNITNCGGECCDCKLRDNFRSYTSKAAFKFVWFPSREGQDGIVNITAWWLPDKEDAEADRGDEQAAGNNTVARRLSAPGPVIVLIHGMSASSNDGRPATVAYLLRSMGFSVLLPNLRGHGSSGSSDGKYKGWSSGYPYDILGAWDYVVKDPENKLGGPRHPSQVGIQGASMGGFASASAFGLEPNVPALLLDAAMLDPIDAAMRKVPIPYFLVGPAWRLMEIFVGVPMRANLPAETLPEACAADGPKPGWAKPKPRHVMVVGSPDDTDIPREVCDRYVDILKGTGSCYAVETAFSMRGTCNDGGKTTHNHNVLQWTAAAEYRQTMCTFWSRALLNAECPTGVEEALV